LAASKKENNSVEVRDQVGDRKTKSLKYFWIVIGKQIAIQG
jgi:hypothetical protein